MATRTIDPATAATAPDLHPVVRRVLRMIERGAKDWQTITVEDRPFTMPRATRTRTWFTIRATRNEGTLVAETLQVYVRTSGGLRAAFLGGHLFEVLVADKRITTWEDLRRAVWA